MAFTPVHLKPAAKKCRESEMFSSFLSGRSLEPGKHREGSREAVIAVIPIWLDQRSP